MPVLNRIAAYAEEMKGWRHHLHQYPELSYDLPQTAAFVAARASGGWASARASGKPRRTRSVII